MTIPQLNAQDFEKASKYDSLIVDCRAPLDFIKGFIPSSVYLAPNFFKYNYLKDFFNREEHLQYFLIAEAEEAEEKASWINKQSGKQIAGVLEGGFRSWEDAAEPIDVIISIEPDEMMMDMKREETLRLTEFIINEEETMNEHEAVMRFWERT
ncbi:MAG: rhodanese-like domain-containing protein [Sphingobacteriales bacterium]|nr:MAG: rhodanese-like domain-containing protein [Sphingobacteriales bacterium]